jgi:hypothetical protein
MADHVLAFILNNMVTLPQLISPNAQNSDRIYQLGSKLLIQLINFFFKKPIASVVSLPHPR